MAPMDTVELNEGIRVGIELVDGTTCIARVERVVGDSVHLRLLDDLPASAVGPNGTLDVFVPRPEGIYRWPARLSGPPEGDAAVVALLGAVRLVQRRVHPRVTVDLTAEVRRLLHGRRDRPREARIADLSHGGMKLLTAGPVEPGDRVEIAVDLGTGRMALTGRVVMAHGDPSGDRVANVAFADELSGALSAIDAYLARRLHDVR